MHLNEIEMKFFQIERQQLLNQNKMRENRNRSSENYSPERSSESSGASHDLIKKEQDYRHQWQDKYLKSNTFNFRLGQVCGLIYNLALLWLVYDLVQDGEKNLAIKIFFGNIAILAFALLVTSIERRVLSRKPPRRGHDSRFKNRDKNHRSNDRDNRGSDRRRNERPEVRR
jgi:hypothetical protein